MQRLCTLLATLFVLVGLDATADVQIIERRQTDAAEVAGRQQPSSERTIRYSFGDQRVRREEEGTTILLRFDQQKMFIVDDSERSVTEIALPIDLPALVPEEMRPTLELMLESMSMQATVTPRDETRKVGQWKTRRYDLEMSNASGMSMQVTMWVSQDLPVDQDLFDRSVEALMALVPGSQDWIDQLRSIRGIPVRRETVLEVMGSQIHTVETIESVTETEVPPGHYDPPTGYQPKPFDLGAQMQRAMQ